MRTHREQLTSVGKETGILSELLDHAPAFRTLMFTISSRRTSQIKWMTKTIIGEKYSEQSDLIENYSEATPPT